VFKTQGRTKKTASLSKNTGHPFLAASTGHLTDLVFKTQTRIKKTVGLSKNTGHPFLAAIYRSPDRFMV
jgi:hypothetical protein